MEVCVSHASVASMNSLLWVNAGCVWAVCGSSCMMCNRHCVSSLFAMKCGCQSVSRALANEPLPLGHTLDFLGGCKGIVVGT